MKKVTICNNANRKWSISEKDCSTRNELVSVMKFNEGQKNCLMSNMKMRITISGNAHQPCSTNNQKTYCSTRNEEKGLLRSEIITVNRITIMLRNRTMKFNEKMKGSTRNELVSVMKFNEGMGGIADDEVVKVVEDKMMKSNEGMKGLNNKKANSTAYKVGDLKDNKVYKEEKIISNEIFPSDPKGSLDGPKEEVLFFIDSGFLTKLSKHLGGGKYLKYKVRDLIKNISIKECLTLKKAYYYTAPPFQTNNPTREESLKKENYDVFKEALTKEGIIVREGRVQRLRILGEFTYKQKSVDILLAKDLMNVKTEYKEINKIILISSDTDFCPIIDDLVNNKITVILYTYFDRKRKSQFSLSNHLIASCSRHAIIKLEDFAPTKEVIK